MKQPIELQKFLIGLMGSKELEVGAKELILRGCQGSYFLAGAIFVADESQFSISQVCGTLNLALSEIWNIDEKSVLQKSVVEIEEFLQENGIAFSQTESRISLHNSGKYTTWTKPLTTNQQVLNGYLVFVGETEASVRASIEFIELLFSVFQVWSWDFIERRVSDNQNLVLQSTPPIFATQELLLRLSHDINGSLSNLAFIASSLQGVRGDVKSLGYQADRLRAVAKTIETSLIVSQSVFSTWPYSFSTSSINLCLQIAVLWQENLLGEGANFEVEIHQNQNSVSLELSGLVVLWLFSAMILHFYEWVNGTLGKKSASRYFSIKLESDPAGSESLHLKLEAINEQAVSEEWHQCPDWRSMSRRQTLEGVVTKLGGSLLTRLTPDRFQLILALPASIR